MSTLYVFSDETGNLDFSPHETKPGATRYYGVGTVVLRDQDQVAALESDLNALRLRLMREGAVLLEDGFHASEEKQAVRDEVYKLLSKHPIVADVTMLEKAKALPRIRETNPLFYKYAWYYHFKQLMQRDGAGVDELVVVAASLGTKAMKQAYRQAVTDVVRQCAGYRIKQHVTFWSASSTPLLSSVDYTTWAVNRYFERQDDRALQQIRSRVRSHYDLFGIGSTYYYGPNKRETPAS